MPPIHSNVVSADHKAPTMCFRDEGREGWKSNKLDCGNIQISHSHSYVTRPSRGKVLGRMKKSAYQPVSNSVKDGDTGKIKTPIEANAL